MVSERDRPAEKTEATSEIGQVGVNELCLWHDPSCPISEISPEAMKAAYIAMGRQKQSEPYPVFETESVDERV